MPLKESSRNTYARKRDILRVHGRAFLTIHLRQALLGVLLLSLIWGTVLWEARRIEHARLERFHIDLMHLSEVLDVMLVQELTGLDNALLFLRAEYRDHRADLGRTLGLLREGPLRNIEAHIVAIDRNGRQEFSDRSGKAASLSQGARSQFRVFAEGGADRLHISVPFIDPLSQAWGLELSRPLLGRDGRFLGVMYIILPPEQLTRFIQTLNIGADTIMSVLSSEGALISRSLDFEKFQSSRLNAEQLGQYQRQATGYSLRPSVPDQIRRGTAHRWISAYPLLLLVSRSPNRTLDKTGGQKNGLLIAGAGASLMVLGALWLLGGASRRQRRDDLELRIAEKAFQTQEGMFVTDDKGVILRINPAFTDITGYTADDIVGQNPSYRSSGLHDAVFYDAMWQRIRDAGSWKGEIWNRRKNGATYPESLSITAVRGDHGEVTHYVASIHDISDRKSAEEKVQKLANYDPLTELPNRRLLRDRLQQAVAASVRQRHHVMLMFIDLDKFKLLNDTRGHEVGDLLLKQVATRLLDCVRDSDTVARLGGDEFVVLIANLSEDPTQARIQAEQVASKILAAMNAPYMLDGQAHSSTPSIGATLFSAPLHTPDELLKQADLAMYQAKAAGRNNIRFFDAGDQVKRPETGPASTHP